MSQGENCASASAEEDRRSLTVACVLRSGGVYDATWVGKLRNGVARHLSLPHRFVCLTDKVREVDAAGIEAIELPEPYPGWWSKLCLWHPSVGLSGPTFYLDLDTVVVGSLDAIAGHRHEFTMAHEYYRPDRMCSTAMAWTGDQSFLFDAFMADPKGIARLYDDVLPAKDGRIGDQSFIEDQFRAFGVRPDTFRDLFGERAIASYKVHRCEKAPPEDAAVVAFHGRPKPCDFKSGWVVEAWR